MSLSAFGEEHTLKMAGGQRADILFKVALIGEKTNILASENPSTAYKWQV